MAAKSLFCAYVPRSAIRDPESAGENPGVEYESLLGLSNESSSDPRSRTTDPGRECSEPLIRNFRYSDRFIRPSSQTTIEATVSLPWIVEISKHSIRRGTVGSASTDRRVSSAS